MLLKIDYETRDVVTGGFGGAITPPKKIIFAPSPKKKQFYSVVTSEFLLDFWLNWHQNNNKLA